MKVGGETLGLVASGRGRASLLQVEREMCGSQKTSVLDRHLLLGASMNKCDVNLTEGVAGEELGKGKGLGLAYAAQGTFLSSFFLNPGCVSGLPTRLIPGSPPVMRVRRKQEGSSSRGDHPPPANHRPLALGRERLTRRASHSPPSASFLSQGSPTGQTTSCRCSCMCWPAAISRRCFSTWST